MFFQGESLSRVASVQWRGLWTGKGSLSRGVVFVQGDFCPGGLCPGDLCPGGDLPTESEIQVVRILPECFLVMMLSYSDYLKM